MWITPWFQNLFNHQNVFKGIVKCPGFHRRCMRYKAYLVRMPTLKSSGHPSAPKSDFFQTPYPNRLSKILTTAIYSKKKNMALELVLEKAIKKSEKNVRLFWRRGLNQVVYNCGGGLKLNKEEEMSWTCVQAFVSLIWVNKLSHISVGNAAKRFGYRHFRERDYGASSALKVVG